MCIFIGTEYASVNTWAWTHTLNTTSKNIMYSTYSYMHVQQTTFSIKKKKLLNVFNFYWLCCPMQYGASMIAKCIFNTPLEFKSGEIWTITLLDFPLFYSLFHVLLLNILLYVMVNFSIDTGLLINCSVIMESCVF